MLSRSIEQISTRKTQNTLLERKPLMYEKNNTLDEDNIELGAREEKHDSPEDTVTDTLQGDIQRESKK